MKVKCDANCGCEAETTIVEKEGKKLRFPPLNWSRLTVINPHNVDGMVEQRHACSLQCYRALINAVMLSTLPPDTRKAAESALDAIAQVQAHTHAKREWMN